MKGSQTQTIRVLVVDDHKSFLWGICKLIDGESPRMKVAGRASDRESALALVCSASPDIVLLDIKLGEEYGLDLLPEILAACTARVIILTGESDGREHERAISLGASGVVLKTEEPEVILRAIEMVHKGQLWLDRAATARVFERLTRGAADQNGGDDIESVRKAALTPKEREVICALVEAPGDTIEEIARGLNVSPKTLTNHLTSIYSNLGIEPPNSRLKLFMYAKAHGLDRRPS